MGEGSNSSELNRRMESNGAANPEAGFSIEGSRPRSFAESFATHEEKVKLDVFRKLGEASRKWRK